MIGPDRRKAARGQPAAAGVPLTRATRTFRQARARATREAIIKAARELFERRGFDATQTPDIAARAGASVGSFYRYFHDKRHVFLDVVENYHEETQREAMRVIATRVAEAQRGGRPDPRETVRAVIDTLFDNVQRQREIVRVYQAMSLRDPDVARLRSEFEARVRGNLTQFLAPITSRKRIPDARAAAEVVYVAAVQNATAQFVQQREPRGGASERVVRQALVDMIHRYLFGEARRTVAE